MSDVLPLFFSCGCFATFMRADPFPSSRSRYFITPINVLLPTSTEPAITMATSVRSGEVVEADSLRSISPDMYIYIIGNVITIIIHGKIISNFIGDGIKFEIIFV
ncbi:MAG: hypothetical protein Hyperionvirus20_36 [Hyperionvirus sp.]|uniref:Uncharacterized protein n=1 Tax=Hyperionvirus sp. TaxID=2487770 RepID=A0A3G5AAI6_9VIRU|nr:MAG: hypothetical protein Hyperionvirus20_36 [Hyperionvirus sp.]